MRKSYDSLSALVVAGLSRDVLSGDCFLFVGKDLRRAKVLLWDGTGLCVYQKRLEQGRFTAPWRKTPADRTAKSLRMTMSELSLFLEGALGRAAWRCRPSRWCWGPWRDLPSGAMIPRHRMSEACGRLCRVLHLARENNVDVLRQAAMLLDQENHKLIEKNLALTRENLSLKGEPQLDLAMKLEELEQQLARRNQKLFGDSSEKRRRSAKADEEAEPQRGHGPREQPELPIVEEIHKLDVPDQTCPQCGGQLQEWAGQFEESFETDVLERRFIRRKHKRQKYRCACQSCVETAPGPAKLTKGGQYSVELAVQVAVSKYLDHLPLERQARIMQRQGLIIDSQTLWIRSKRWPRTWPWPMRHCMPTSWPSP